MEKFTKGPWHLDEFGNILPAGATDSLSCIRAGGLALAQNKGEPMYNRHLIAAAPEMYDMLSKLSSQLTGINAHDAVSDIERILAKARGEK